MKDRMQPSLEKDNPSKEAIIRAAKKEFSERGLAGARIDVVARNANVNKQTIYYYFENKDSLYSSVLNHGYLELYKDIQVLIESGKLDKVSAKRAVYLLVVAFFDAVVDCREVMSIISDSNKFGGAHVAEQQRIRESARQYFDELSRHVARGVKGKVFRSGIDFDEFWLSVISMTQFWWHQRYTISNVLGYDVSDEKLFSKRRETLANLAIRSIER